MDTTQFELIDPRPISDERYLEIAGWHDCMHPVAASDPPLEEEWCRVNDLINALAHALARLATPGYPLGLSRADVLDAACEVYSWRKREGEIMRCLLHMVDDRDQQVFATAIENEELRARLSTVEAANARYESPETDLREGPWTQGKERQRQQLQLEHQQLKQQVVSLEGEVQGLIRERAALVDDLLGPDSTSLESRLAKANSQVAELKQELAEQRGAVASLLEDLANGCAPVKMEPGKDTTPYWRGVNTERAKTLEYAELKCKELGIEWPIKPIPYAGNLPSELAPGPVAMPGAPGGPLRTFTGKPLAAPLLEEAVPAAGPVLVDACEVCAYRQPEDAESLCPRCGNGIYVAMTIAKAYATAKEWAHPTKKSATLPTTGEGKEVGGE